MNDGSETLVGFVGAHGDALFKKPYENIGFDSIAVPFEDGVPVPEKGRKITPGAPGPHDPKYRFDEAPVVAPASSGVRRLTQANAAPSSPIGRPSAQIVPSKA